MIYMNRVTTRTTHTTARWSTVSVSCFLTYPWTRWLEQLAPRRCSAANWKALCEIAFPASVSTPTAFGFKERRSSGTPRVIPSPVGDPRRDWCQGELVIQKRSASKDTFPGMWDVSVGGHFTAGEGSLETAVKETREELGIDCDERDLRFVCTVPTSSTGSTALHGKFICNEFKDLYLMRYDGPLEGLKFSPDEVDEVKLIPINDLRGVYAREDPQYIIRPVYYVDALVAALKDALGSA